MAISGIPPFAGFFSKDEILAAAAQVSPALYILATITAFMTAFYMARLLFVAFMGQPANQEAYAHAHEVGWFMRVPLIVLSVLSVVSGIWAHMAGFGDWVRFGAPAHEGMNLMIAGTSTLLAVIALALAWKV